MAENFPGKAARNSFAEKMGEFVNNRGLQVTYTQHSDEGAKFIEKYSSGCVEEGNDQRCKFRWGETMSKNSSIFYTREIEDGSIYTVNAVYYLRGYLQKLYGPVMKFPTLRCKACGETCVYKMPDLPVFKNASLMQIPMPPCPIPVGEFKKAPTVAALPALAPPFSLFNYDLAVNETMEHKDGTLAFHYVGKLHVGQFQW
jgi:hypothetical protein